MDATEMEAHIQKLQSLVAAQQAQLERLLKASERSAAANRSDGIALPARKRLSRKGLLKVAAMGAAGIAGAELAGSLTASPAGATGGGITPDYVEVTGPSTFGVNCDAASHGNTEFQTGVAARGSQNGVFAQADGNGTSTSSGVFGNSNSPHDNDYGVYGLMSNNPPGVGSPVWLARTAEPARTAMACMARTMAAGSALPEPASTGRGCREPRRKPMP